MERETVAFKTGPKKHEKCGFGVPPSMSEVACELHCWPAGKHEGAVRISSEPFAWSGEIQVAECRVGPSRTERRQRDLRVPGRKTIDGLNRDQGSRQVVVPNRLFHGESLRKKASPDLIAESGRGKGAWFTRKEPHCSRSERVVNDRHMPVVDPRTYSQCEQRRERNHPFHTVPPSRACE